MKKIQTRGFIDRHSLLQKLWHLASYEVCSILVDYPMLTIDDGGDF